MKRALPLAVAAAVIAAWWGLATQLPSVLLPTPPEVAQAAWQGRDKLLESTLRTAASSALGLGLASAVGLTGAMAFLRARWLEHALYPYALLLQTVPIIAIAPLLVVWLGYGSPVAVVTAALVCFFPILSSANLGLRSAAPAQLELFKLLGAGWLTTLWKLRLPASLPFVLSGYRTAVGLSVIGAIVGEFVASNGMPPSLGYLVLQSARSADTPTTFAAIGASTALALALFLAVRAIERWVIGGWHPES